MKGSKAHGLVALFIAVLLSLCCAACGGTNKYTGSTILAGAGPPLTGIVVYPPRGGYLRTDNDVDELYGEDDPRTSDDSPITEYGHAASKADKRKISELIKRYYSIATTGSGAAACSLISWRLVKDPGLTRTVPEDRYARPVLLQVTPGESCAQVATLLFRKRHQSLATEVATLQVTSVRVGGVHGVALLGFRTAPRHWIPIIREGSVWKVHAFLASELP